MMDRQDIGQRLLFPDKAAVILDIGILYSKIGFVGDNMPRKIIKTPQNLFKQLKMLNLEKKVFLADCFQDVEKLKYELENFLHDIFYIELIVNPQDRNVFYIENIMMPRIFVDSLSDMLFNRFNVKKVYYVMGNSMPLYCSGLYSGIIVDCGFYETQILPVFEGYPIIKALQQSQASGYNQNLLLKRKLFFEDNPNLTDKIFDINRIENIKFKFITVPQRQQYIQYTESEDNIRKMKHSLQDYEYQIYDEQTNQWGPIKISYYTRLTVGNYLFGNIEEDEPNIAYSLLQSLLNIDQSYLLKVSKNIILTGGQCQIKGFAQRMRQELLHFLDNNQEFKKLKKLKEELQFTNILYPSNTLHFIGTSMIGPIQASEQFAVTAQQFQSQKLQDIFGENYIYMQPEEEMVSDSHSKSFYDSD